MEEVFGATRMVRLPMSEEQAGRFVRHGENLLDAAKDIVDVLSQSHQHPMHIFNLSRALARLQGAICLVEPPPLGVA